MLKGNAHLYFCRLYFLRQLKRSNIATKDLLSFYLVCVRPITEYACQVFHNALPQYLSEDLERLQTRALRIIFPGLSFKEALNASNLHTLKERRELLTTTLFKEAVENKSHKLNKLLPPQNKCSFNLRSKRQDRQQDSLFTFHYYLHSYFCNLYLDLQYIVTH